MSCVNIKSKEYKSLVKGLNKRQEIIARGVITRFMNDNNDKLPSYTEFKTLMSDLYNTPRSGKDYSAFHTKVKEIVKSMLPSITDEELDLRLQFVDKLDLMRMRGGKQVLTSFINDVIYVSNSTLEERGTQAYKDIRHEIFHLIFNDYLSDQEKEKIMETFKRWKPEYSNITDAVELEERMADAFEDFKVNPSKSIPVIIKEFFRDLFKFLGFISDNYNDIQRLFNDVELGRFTRDFVKDSLVTRDKDIISKYTEFTEDLDFFLQVKAFVVNNLNEMLFPHNNKELSELHNSGLFLDVKYDNQLFKNNKDLYKLGLSKNEALKELQKRIKSLNSKQNVDPELTRILKFVSVRGKLKDMFDYLQPYSIAEVNSDGELELKNQIQRDPTETLLESDEEINSLEIGSKELINPITKISEVVKDFISSVTYQNADKQFVNIDPGAGFIALLNLFSGIYGNNSVEDNLESIKNNYSDSAKGNQTKAVYNKLVELHNAVIGYNRINLNIKNVPQSEVDKLKSIFDDNGIEHETIKDTLVAILPDNMQIRNEGTNSNDNTVVFEFNRFKEGKKSFKIKQNASETNKTFIEKISNITGLPNFVVAKLFNYNEQRNQLAEITKVAGSLRKLSPKFVKITSKRGFIDGETVNEVTYAFINKVNEFKDSISISSEIRERLDIPLFRKQIITKINQYKKLQNSTKTTAKDLNSLLFDLIGVNGTGLQLVSTDDFSRIDPRNVSIILNNFERIVDFVSDIHTDKPAADFTNRELYLLHTSNLGDLLNRYTFEKNNSTSFTTSTSNKSKWENVMKSTGFMILNNLKNFANGIIKADKLFSYLRDSFNNYLKFNPVFEHNYNNSTSTVDNNLLKVKDSDFISDFQETFQDNPNATYIKPPVPFGKETPRDWINRNFLAMFQLPILESRQKNKSTEQSSIGYYQQKFQPESAPNVGMVKMGINSAETLENNLLMMILQEAYMNDKFSTSNRKNLRNNTKKSILPGLEINNPYYFLDKNKQNTFFENGNLKPEFGQIVNGKLVINKQNKLLQSLLSTMMLDLDNSIKSFVDLAISEKATIIGSNIEQMYEKIKSSYPEIYKLSKEELDNLRGIYIDGKTDITAFKRGELYNDQRSALIKAMSVFYLNSFVNGFFMNQLTSGSTQNYKNPLDEIKRQAGVNAMNDTGLIDDKHGMPQTYRNVVISDASSFYGLSNPLGKIPLLQRFFKNKIQEVADAQSWDIPEYKALLRKSFGKSVDIGVATKDVHFEVNESGGVDYRKTSSVELTNELVRKNKTFRDLRFTMTFERYLNSLSSEERSQVEPRIKELYEEYVENDGFNNIDSEMEYKTYLEDAAPFMIHKASFASAIKGSKPTEMSKFNKNPETGTYDFDLKEGSILELNSSFNGIQQAIRHRYIDSFISHFTQLTYLIGLNRTPTSIKNNRIITRTLSKFTKAGIFDTLFDLKMAYDLESKLLKANTRSKKEFIKALVKKLDLPGNENIISLLTTVVDGKGISMNNPLFSEKLIQTFFNTFTKKTVSPKHPGGSFVLQSEFGFEQDKTNPENSLKTPELVRDSEGNILYAEAYVSEMYSDQLKTGELVYYNNDEYNKMFGFRIPSSDLHSSVPLRIIGYYPSTSHDNVIVVPAAVTALHGSDFDVDKLFVVRYGVFGVSDKDIDPKAVDQSTPETSNTREYKTKFQSNNIVIAQKGIKFGFTAPNVTYDKRGNLVDFGDNTHNEISNLDEILIDEKEKTKNRIVQKETELLSFDKESKTLTLTGKLLAERRALRNDKYKEIKNLEKHLEQLKTIQKGFYSNTILNAVLDNISYSGENASDIFFGITFDPVKGYEEESEYSQLARVFSDINKANSTKGGITVYMSYTGNPNIMGDYVYVAEDKEYSKIFGPNTMELKLDLKGKKVLDLEKWNKKLRDVGEQGDIQIGRFNIDNKYRNEIGFIEQTLGTEAASEFINEFKNADVIKGIDAGSSSVTYAVRNKEILDSKNSVDLIPERPKLFKTYEEIDVETLDNITNEYVGQLGLDLNTEEGKTDVLNLANESLKEDWIKERDRFIDRNRTPNKTGSININKIEHHVNVHKETYMAAGLVGLIANFSKGLAYAFHGITDNKNEIDLGIPENERVIIDGQEFNTLVLENKDNIKTQEIRSLALNASIDHVKEQILNVLNVGDNTAKIFLAAVSTKMNLHQTTMLMLQPVTKELNSSDATKVTETLNKLSKRIQAESGIEVNQELIDKTEVTTKELEKNINKSLTEILEDVENPNYKNNLILQYKILSQLSTLNTIGEEVSSISKVLSVIQGLPYNLESAYEKMNELNKFIDIEKFINKLEFTEKSEYTKLGFKEDLKSPKTLFTNVNLANNENVLAAIEAIKTQLDIVSEMFSENSLQAQFVVDNMFRAISNNSNPETIFASENNENLTPDTTAKLSVQEKYLKGKSKYNIFRLISRNIFNYLTTGLNISYNDNQHIFSLGIHNQDLKTLVKDEKMYNFGTVKSYLNAFLMNRDDARNQDKNYNGQDFVTSQINPEWRIKPLSIIKQQNPSNRFLRGVALDTNFRDNVRTMSFSKSLANTAENLAAVKQAVNELNNLNNIYVRLDKKGRWVDVPPSLHPVTTEMNEVVFNILKASLYTDKFKFGSNKITNVIPPKYYHKIFLSLDTITKDLLYYNKSETGNKYYKDYSDLENTNNQLAIIDKLKENIFINTIFGMPDVLPNLRSLLPSAIKNSGKKEWQMVHRQAGFMPNGNIFDLYLDSTLLESQESQEDNKTKTTDEIEKTDENTNAEMQTDLSEAQAEADLYKSFRRNPSFIVDESRDRKGNYELYMKVGETGSKETGDLKYYYKKIGTSNGKLTNNSFDLNLLLNNYHIKDYYNPKRVAIPLRQIDFSGSRISLKNINISSFLVTAKDDNATINENREAIEKAIEQQLEIEKAKSENEFLTDKELRAKISTRFNVENVVNQLSEVALYDSRNMDRVGLKNFKIISKKVHSDQKMVDFELEVLPDNQQIRYNKFDTPLIVLNTLRKNELTNEEKIKFINSVPGGKVVTLSQELTDAEINAEFDRALEEQQSREIDEVLKNKSCK